jgi:hypothetical protein
MTGIWSKGVGAEKPSSVVGSVGSVCPSQSGIEIGCMHVRIDWKTCEGLPRCRFARSRKVVGLSPCGAAKSITGTVMGSFAWFARSILIGGNLRDSGPGRRAFHLTSISAYVSVSLLLLCKSLVPCDFCEGSLDPPIATNQLWYSTCLFSLRFRLPDSPPLFLHNGSRPRSRSI